MKVLLYSENFYPQIGGIETCARLIANDLHERGVSITLVTQTPFSGIDEFPYDVIRAPSKEVLIRIIKNADLVYLNVFHADIFVHAKLNKKKIVFTYHDLTMICPKGTKWRIDGPCVVSASLPACVPCLKHSGESKVLRRLLRPIIKSLISCFIDANICTSYFGYERYYLRNKKLILNGIDTSYFLPPTKKVGKDQPIILFVGRLIAEKGCQTLLEAAAILKNDGTKFGLHICGDGPHRKMLEEHAVQLGLTDSVKFFGNVQGAKHVDILQNSDIAVVPSLIDEPFGLTAIEAMSCSLPVVAANVGGLGKIVSECGFVFERGNVVELSRHLRSLINDVPRRMSVGEESRRVAVEKYDCRLMTERYYQLFVGLSKTRDDSRLN